MGEDEKNKNGKAEQEKMSRTIAARAVYLSVSVRLPG
jgi:hypothetical protein